MGLSTVWIGGKMRSPRERAALRTDSKGCKRLERKRAVARPSENRILHERFSSSSSRGRLITFGSGWGASTAK